MNIKILLACSFAMTLLAGQVVGRTFSQSNEQVPSPKIITDSYPLANDAARQKTTQLLQQLVVDLLATFNNYKEAHWNLSGPIYLPLHEFYDEQATMYLDYVDVLSERVLSMGYSIDGRYTTIARTSTIPYMPAGYMSDNSSLRLLVERVTVLQEEVYKDITATEQSDATTSNILQELAYDVDHNLWQLRIHLQRPGSTGQNLPWVQ
jgi:starvation-inducible DNA-binding protein